MSMAQRTALTIRRRPVALRVYRAAHDLSQRELADLAGCAKGTVSNLERGTVSGPRPETARALAAALGVEPEVLFGD